MSKSFLNIGGRVGERSDDPFLCKFVCRAPQKDGLNDKITRSHLFYKFIQPESSFQKEWEPGKLWCPEGVSGPEVD